MTLPRFYKLKVKDVKKETDDSVCISLDVPESLKDIFVYQHGQHLTFRKMIESEDVRRSYSLCSSPLDNEWKVGIREIEGGAFSTFANGILQKGDEIEVMPPSGNFHTVLDANKASNYVAFAAGSGITPLLSIIKTTLQSEPHSTFSLFYSNRTSNSTMFREELENMKNQFMSRLALFLFFSRERVEIPIFNGRFDKEKFERVNGRLFNAGEIDSFFICGPESFIFEIKDALTDIDVPAEKIHFELFTSPVGKLGTSKKKTEEKTYDTGAISKVSVFVDGVHYDFPLGYDSDSILDAAMKAGADLPYACKGGVCATCKAKLLEGKIEMDINYGLEPDEIENGYILTCQSHPRTDTVKVDYDVH